MKFSYSLPAALIGAAAIAIIQLQIAVALTPEQAAEKITVLIDENGKALGSGVILDREGNTYYVLTVKHVMEYPGKYRIVTSNRRRYPINYSRVIKLPGVDLAILQFTSGETYTTADLGDSDKVTVGANVYISGYTSGGKYLDSIRQFTTGKISSLPSRPLGNGYGLVYTNITGPGMSGGCVLDEQGRLIGIHGRTEGQIDSNGQVVGKPGFNLGIPIKNFVYIAPKAYSNQGIEKLKRQDYQGAIASFNQALRFNANSAGAYTGRGYARFAQENYSGASEDATKALELNPRSADAYRLRGASLAQQGKHRDAIEDFNLAIQINPYFADAYGFRGVSRARVGDAKGAFADINQAISLAPNNANSYSRSSVVRNLLGDTEVGRAHQQKSNELWSSGGEDAYQLALNRGAGSPLPRKSRTSEISEPPPAGEPRAIQSPVMIDPPPKLRSGTVTDTPDETSRPTFTNLAPRNNQIAARLPANWTAATTLTAKSKVFAVAISPDGQTIASGSEDGKIRLWNVYTKKVRRTIPGHPSPVRSIAFSQDGKKLATGGMDGTTRVWDVHQGRLLRTFKAEDEAHVYSVAFSQSGQTLATGLANGTIQVWQVDGGKLFRNLTGHSEAVYSLAYNPDGKTIASSSGDKTIKVWSLRQEEYGKLLQTFAGHKDLIWSVAFIPGQQTLVSSSLDRSIKLWNLNTKQLLGTLPLGSFVAAYDVAISPDGKTLAIGSNLDIKLWNLSNGQLLGTLSGHSDLVRSLAFSSDGKTLASGSDDNNVRIWQIRERYFNP